MGIFGSGKSGPTKVNGIRITQSKQGYPLPWLMGQNKIQQSLIWMSGLHDVSGGSGGKGGGKGGGEYLYTADVIAALCAGNVTGIGNVWSGQTWLSTTGTNEVIGALAHTVYAPSFAATLMANDGVALTNTYSSTYTDFGAPASTVLSGSDLAPMTLVPYGTVLTTGQYSINPASIGTFTVTSCTTASGGSTTYNGTFTGGTSPYTSGASNAYIGFAFVIAGFVTNTVNNGTFTCSASTATSITVNNTAGVAETHAATAVETGNTYHFSTVDMGKSAQVSYQFSMQEFLAQETDLIPSGLVIYPGEAFGPQIDRGVVYYNNGTSIDGTALTAVTGTPTVSGTYKFTSNNSSQPKYQFASADVNKEVLISWGYQNKAAVTAPSDTLLNFELFGGGLGQPVAPYLLTGLEHSDNGQEYFNPAYPGEALGYSGIAYALFYPMELGSSAEIQDNTFEVLTSDAFGGGITDCNPVTCIYNVLTNTTQGLGSGKTPFPISAIDNGSSGTWGGAASTPGTRSTSSTAWNWFASQSFFISPVMDNQDSASSAIGKWLEAGMCSAFMSEGLLKLVPYGDTSAAGNGCTWVAPQNFVVALDDTCYLGKEGEDPVKIERSAWQDASNKVQIQFKNRSNQYADEIVQESDQAAINRYGLRLEDPQDWDFVTTLTAATFAANMRLKRSVNTRNTYTFSLPYTYSYLEPMDIVTISTTSQWAANTNNTNLGIVNMAVRITKIVDDPKSGLEITAEDYVWGAHQPVLYNKGISAGDVVINAYSQPDASEVVMFEATSRLTQFQGNQIWIGAAGVSSNWGSTNVWVSQDQTKYLQVGSITSPSRLGTLASNLALGTDPDTTDSMVVTLVDNSAPLEAGTTTDADSNNTMCYVGGEIISYSACALTGASQYTMNGYMRRGQMGSTIGAHAAGSLFMRLDDTILKYTYDPTWYGKTLYFKFQSVNNFGNCPQDLATLTAVPFTVPGLNPGTISASTGLVEGGCIVGGVTPPTVLNPNFELGDTGWYKGTGWAIGQAGQSWGSGSYTGLCSAGSGTSAISNNAQTPCTPGQVWSAQCMALPTPWPGSAGLDGTLDARVCFVNAVGAVISYQDGNQLTAANTATNGWFLSKATMTAPAGASAVYMDIACYSHSVGTWMVDACQLNFVGDNTSTSLNGQGSITITQNLTTLPTYSATTSSITFNISAQSLTRADGSTLNIIAGSQTFGGLSASTAYYLYPYINAATGIMGFANTSTLSTSANSLYMLQANGDGHMALAVNSAGTQVLSTTSSGTQGGGGGAGSCPEGQELVEEQTKGVIKAIDVKVGDSLKGKVFATGNDVYRKVIQTSTQAAAIWRMVDGHKVSPCEPLWHEGMWKPAYQAAGSTIAYGNGTRVNLSLETDDYNEQNYYLVEGTPLLIHNMRLSNS